VHDCPIIARCRNIEKYEFIRALDVVRLGTFDRIPGIAELLKLDALYDTPRFDIETGYDSAAKHGEGDGETGTFKRGQAYPEGGRTNGNPVCAATQVSRWVTSGSKLTASR
jgi:hypothetical protein